MLSRHQLCVKEDTIAILLDPLDFDTFKQKKTNTKAAYTLFIISLIWVGDEGH